MAVIKPFRALHPTNETAEQVAALPYDVYSRAEAREVVQGKPLSFLNIDRPETQFPEDQDMYATCVYEKAAELLNKMEADGVMTTDAEACYYVYELTMNGRVQTGLVAASSVDDYETGVIKKHENTRKDKEEDRIRHVDTTSAQTGPIFLTYRAVPAITELIEKVKGDEPMFAFTADDGVSHRGWKIADKERIAVLTEAFAAIPNTYIADGHHRAASAVAVSRKRREANPSYTGNEEFNYFLSVLFPDEELAILDYNRVLKDLNGKTAKELLKELAVSFDVAEAPESPYAPKAKGEFGLLLDGKWYRLTLHSDLVSDDAVDGLDVAVLQREVLTKIWKIDDPRTDHRIDFVGGIRGLGELEKRCKKDCSAAFAMYPTSIDELLRVADENRLMPPKSTWFEPKLRSGLFIHKIEK